MADRDDGWLPADEKLTPERAVRLLRAKGAELENKVLRGLGPTDIEVRYLAADIALIAQLLADHIETAATYTITSSAQVSGTTIDVPAEFPVGTEVTWTEKHPDDFGLAGRDEKRESFESEP